MSNDAITITLPFPPADLSQNSRKHWSKKEAMRSNSKIIGHDRAKPFKGMFVGLISLTLIFIPPDNRHRDMDNCLASAKFLLDGVAAGLGVNDSQFRPITIDMGKPDRKNPRLEITIRKPAVGAG